MPFSKILKLKWYKKYYQNVMGKWHIFWYLLKLCSYIKMAQLYSRSTNTEKTKEIYCEIQSCHIVLLATWIWAHTRIQIRVRLYSCFFPGVASPSFPLCSKHKKEVPFNKFFFSKELPPCRIDSRTDASLKSSVFSSGVSF